jgi:membrane protein implicated in regulation of membrane protease activity
MNETTITGSETDADAFADRERRETLSRAIIGVILAGTALIALLWYLLEPPTVSAGAILALSVVAAIADVAWLHRCGNSREHRRIIQQNKDQAARLAALEATFELKADEFDAKLDSIVTAVCEELANLAAKVEASQRDRIIGGAKVSLAQAIASCLPGGEERRDHFAVDSPTPAHGLRVAWDRSKEN